jgi:FMN phosphatase YigB (HAD superfamily)
VIKAIIFDCFGVVRVDPMINAYTAMGGDVEKDAEFIRSVQQAADKGLIPNARPVISQHLDISVEEWSKALNDASSIDYELLDYILELKKKYKIGMLSNIGVGGLERWFEPGFLEKYFEVMVASGDIGFAKPEARAYEVIADRLGVRTDECVFTDDRQECVEGGQSVGMKAILYTSLDKFKKDLGKILNGN